jgi:4-amino-4-deoxy-L-arabinose transferase-like glycosyltransferase
VLFTLPAGFKSYAARMIRLKLFYAEVKREHLITGAVLFCMLLVRISAVVAIHVFGSNGIIYREEADPLIYLNGARAILAGGVNPFNFFPPLQFIFIASFLKISGGSTTAALAAQAVVGWLTVMGIYLLARALFDRQTALLAVLISGLYPNLVFYGVNFYSETLALFFIVFSFLMMQYYCVSFRTLYLLCAGVLWGLASLTRGGLHYFSLFMAFVVIASSYERSGRWTVKPAGALLLSTFITLVTVGIALSPVQGNFSLNSKSGIGSLVHGANRITTSCADYGDVRGNIFYIINRCEEQWPEGSQIYSNDLLESGTWHAGRVFLSFIAQEPITYIKMSFRKLSCFWSPNQGVIHFLKTRSGRAAAFISGWLCAGIGLWYVIIVCCGICGIALAGGPFRLLVIFFILFYCLLIFFTVGNSKLRLPLMPFFMIYATHCAVCCWTKRVAWRSLLSRVWVAGALLLLIGNSVYKYGEIALSPAEVQVRKVELCVRLGFPRTARFILEGDGRRDYNASQLERLNEANERINTFLMKERGGKDEPERRDRIQQ